MTFEDRSEPSIAKAHEHPHVKTFKAQDRSGNVYLVTNPNTWTVSEDAEGRTIVTRPKPSLVERGSQKRRKDVL